jgi:hypothetical protein
VVDDHTAGSDKGLGAPSIGIVLMTVNHAMPDAPAIHAVSANGTVSGSARG